MKTIAMAASIAIVAAGAAGGMMVGGAGAQIARSYQVASNEHSVTADVDRAAQGRVATDAAPGAEPASLPARQSPAADLNVAAHAIPEHAVETPAARTSLPRARAVQTAVQQPAQPARQQPTLRLEPPAIPAQTNTQSGTHAQTPPPARVANTAPAATPAAHQTPAATPVAT